MEHYCQSGHDIHANVSHPAHLFLESASTSGEAFRRHGFDKNGKKVRAAYVPPPSFPPSPPPITGTDKDDLGIVTRGDIISKRQEDLNSPTMIT